MLNRLLNIVSLVGFRRATRIDQHERLYIFERAGPTLGVKLAVGPIDVKKLRKQTHGALPNGLGARPSARVFFSLYLSRPGELGPCPVARCPGRRKHRHKRSPPP